MKAIAMTQYGGPDVLDLVEIPEPKVGPDMVLVRVKATSVNPVDWKIREGALDGIFTSHFPLVPGWDVAGVVEAVGPAVTEFAPGDEVIGYVRRDDIQQGTYAELVAAPVRTLAPKPSSAGFEQAAAIPLAGLTAYQALTALEVSDGDTVLVHAASGGVGSYAVQLAAARGARVIGTASEANHDYLRSLGAEPVVYGDGLVERVRELAPDGADAVLDLHGGDLATTPDLLGTPGRVASVIDPNAVKELGGRYVFVRPSTEDLSELARLVDKGVLQIEVARTFPLAEAAEAQRLSQQGHVRGKVVITVP